MKRIFVYGTLLRGERSHHLLSTSALLGEARTAPGFELCDLGEFPGMVRGGSGSVVGELYLVGPDALPALDRLEGHPEVFFRTAVLLASGEEVEAYLFPADKAEGTPRIAEGDWRRRGG